MEEGQLNTVEGDIFQWCYYYMQMVADTKNYFVEIIKKMFVRSINITWH